MFGLFPLQNDVRVHARHRIGQRDSARKHRRRQYRGLDAYARNQRIQRHRPGPQRSFQLLRHALFSPLLPQTNVDLPLLFRADGRAGPGHRGTDQQSGSHRLQPPVGQHDLRQPGIHLGFHDVGQGASFQRRPAGRRRNGLGLHHLHRQQPQRRRRDVQRQQLRLRLPGRAVLRHDIRQRRMDHQPDERGGTPRVKPHLLRAGRIQLLPVLLHAGERLRELSGPELQQVLPDQRALHHERVLPAVQRLCLHGGPGRLGGLGHRRHTRPRGHRPGHRPHALLPRPHD